MTTTDEPAVEDGLPDLSDDAMLEAALEALLLVVDAPTEDDALADGARPARGPRPRHADRDVGAPHRRRAAGSTCAGWGRAGGSTPATAYSPFVERLLLDGQRAKLTRAALETLAVVAYRQPVTRARVAAVRGVNCDGVLRTLMTRGLVEEAGVDGATQGTLFRTTELFLERLGLTSIDDLPPLAPAAARRRRDRCDRLRAWRPEEDSEPRRQAGRRPAAEGARAGGRRVPTRGRGADRGGPGERRRQGRPRDGPPHRPGHRRGARRREPGGAARRPGPPGAEQAVRDALHDVRRAGPPVRR